MDVLDIGSEEKFPISNLSNFTPHIFVIDGVECGSMEGFLQSLKFEDSDKQLKICKLTGIKAKRRGSKRNKQWKTVQKLWWRGKEICRHSNEYQVLLDRAFNELSKNNDFKTALIATGNAELTHSIGKNRPEETVLTIDEFCGRLMKVRESYRKGNK